METSPDLKNNHLDGKNSTYYSLLFERPQADIQMLDLLKDKKHFQEVTERKWWSKTDNNEKSKLRVFVVPFSHNDIGWVKTMDQYYATKTKFILNNMLRELYKDPTKKFIWTEIAYLAMWWEEIDMQSRQNFKQ